MEFLNYLDWGKINPSENASCLLDLASRLHNTCFGLTVDFFALNKWDEAAQAGDWFFTS